jgi:8-oxo-dGTP diphosphatase
VGELVPVVAVGGIVLAPGPRVLLVRRRNPPLTGRWSLPGGKLLGGEAITKGIEREVREETGIRVSAGALVEIVEIVAEGHHYVIHDHLCAPADPDQVPTPGDDATDARYVRPSELSALGVTEAVTRVIMRALAMRQICLEDE